MNHSMKRLTIASLAGLCVVAGLALGACGRDDSTGGATLQPVTLPPTATPEPGPRSPFADLPAAANGELRLPLIEDASLAGGLLFLKDQALYLSWFDGAAPTLIADVVHPYLTALSPDGRRVIYPVGATERMVGYGGHEYNRFGYTLTVTDLVTLESTPLLRPVGDERGLSSIFFGWAPDGQSVALWDQNGLTFVRLDGSVMVTPGLRALAWLPDSTALHLATRPATEEDGQPQPAIYRFSPAQGWRSLIYLPVEDPAMLDFMALEGALHALGIDYDDGFTDLNRAALLPDGSRVYIDWPLEVRSFEAGLCGTWEIRQRPRAAAGPLTTLYRASDTTFLTDLTVLPDGALLFLKWTLEGCQFTGAMRVELLRLVPGRAPELLTDEIDPGASANPNDVRMLAYQRGRKYTVSPDGRYVFWIAGGAATNTSSIRVTDLEHGITATLLTDVITPSGVGRFEDVLWVPRVEG